MINIGLIGCAIVLLWYASPRALVTKLTANNMALHLFLASTLAMTLLAFMQGGANVGMPLHFLGLAAITLILGRELSILAAIICGAILLMTQKMAFNDAGAMLVGGMLLPIITVDYWRKWVTSTSLSTWRFVLFASVGGAIITLLLKTLLLSVYYYYVNEFTAPQVIEQYALLSLLFWVPEMMLNGTIILTLVQHKPHWVATFRTS